MEDKSAIDSIRSSVRKLYNFEFDQSVKSLAKVSNKYPNHPGLKLLGCVRNYWKNFPIGSKTSEYEVYKKDLALVAEQSEALMKKYPKSPEPVYYYMTANLMLARHCSEDGQYIDAVNHARKAFPGLKKGFDLKSRFSDFYFSTGLYNYYREAFPEQHPVYKPFTFFFQDGNKDSGLKELETAGFKSLFSMAEARVFLCNIYLRDYFNIGKALEQALILRKNYPGNWIFSILYAECLVEAGKTNEAANYIKVLLGRTENAALLSGYYLQGLLERKQGRNDAAKWNFQKALMFGKSNDRLTKGQMGLTYNELAKLAILEGNRDQAEKYFDLAEENCSYKKVKDDAKSAGF